MRPQPRRLARPQLNSERSDDIGSFEMKEVSDLGTVVERMLSNKTVSGSNLAALQDCVTVLAIKNIVWMWTKLTRAPNSNEALTGTSDMAGWVRLSIAP